MNDLFDLVRQFDPKWNTNSVASNRGNERQYRLFERCLGRPAVPSDFTSEAIAAARDSLIREGYSLETIAGTLEIVRRVWRYLHAVDPEAVAAPPAVDRGRSPSRKHPSELPKRRALTSRGGKGVLAKPIPVTLPFPSPIDEADQHRDLAIFFERVYWPRKIAGSPLTHKQYVNTLRLMASWLGRRPTLDDLASDTVLDAYLQHRLTSVSAHAAGKCRCNLLAIGNFAFKKKHIDVCPDVPRVIPPDVSPDAWTIDQLRQLLAACQSDRHVIDGLPGDQWWYALHLFALDTGERTSATLALRWEWIDRNTGWVAVPGSARKGRKKAMRYKLRSDTLAAINQLWREGRERVFLSSDSWGTGTFYYHYRNLLKRAGLPTGRRFKLQRMRRTFASLVEKAGGDATRALAHSSRSVTERSYLDETLIDRKPSVEFVELAIGGALASVVVGCDDDDSLPIAKVAHA